MLLFIKELRAWAFGYVTEYMMRWTIVVTIGFHASCGMTDPPVSETYVPTLTASYDTGRDVLS